MLVNGKPGEKIFPSRGLRQEDPLSPYLFILYTEGLSSMINLSEINCKTKGIAVTRGGTRINYLLFVDDYVFFCRAKLVVDQVTNHSIQI